MSMSKLYQVGSHVKTGGLMYISCTIQEDGQVLLYGEADEILFYM